MGKNVLVLCFILLLFFGGVTSVPTTTSPAKIVGGLLSNIVSALMKWLWSLKATTKTVISGRPMMKFESGYTVETVFDGSKLGIEPYSVQVLPSGELLILDSANSNIYRISTSLSLYSRPKLVAGSHEGYSGHVDGKLREAKMNHPKGLTVDDRGNIYVADTMNMAIRKISDAGVTTIAGGKWGRRSHVDGASEDANFSNDFDVVYIGSSCSLLVIDRGNRAIREIQLHFDDCAYQYGSGFPLGIAVLVAAGFFGYMLALLQRRVGMIVSPQNVAMKMSTTGIPYQKPIKLTRPPLIPTEDEQEKHEEGLFGSLGKLFTSTGASIMEILGDSFVIPDEDEPPSIESRTPTPRKIYPFMSKDTEKMHQWRQGRSIYSGGWDGDFQQQQQQQQKQQYHNRYQTSTPNTYYEQSYEKTNEIVFGAVQEQDGKYETTVTKPVDYEDLRHYHNNIRSRTNSLHYANGY
ncbi:hypothetical protein OIU85_005795 [Salix viminalis]|uniref:SMP-30/Gluconolactonase/LRE-like region domain-containing protein n=1 Tax=Salix viminalis TaxID=40686 RepID=A0A9Q0PJP0_SALVM|nr:hypothetical protein OIU85_005795 [Salix viminalis]